MPFNEADFTRDAAKMVAEGDRVPTQREAKPEPLADRLRTLAAEYDAVEVVRAAMGLWPMVARAAEMSDQRDAADADVAAVHEFPPELRHRA